MRRRVLLDENLPRKLRRELVGYDVRTVQEEGWASFRNGELLGRAERFFDVLLTADRRLQFQQNLSRFKIGVVVIVQSAASHDRCRSRTAPHSVVYRRCGSGYFG